MWSSNGGTSGDLVWRGILGKSHLGQGEGRVWFVSVGLPIEGVTITSVPINAKRLVNAGLMLAHRLRHWLDINPAIVHCAVFTGNWSLFDKHCQHSGR